MSAKTQKRKTRSGLRRCFRCGCTENRACEGGCYWILDTDVCSACLTPAEQTLCEFADVLSRQAGALQRIAQEAVLVSKVYNHDLRTVLLTTGAKL